MNNLLTADYPVDNEISLTEIRGEDAPALVKHVNDLDIYRNTITIPYPYLKKDALEFIAICREFEKLHHQICNYAIRKQENLIGVIGLLFNYGVEAHKSEFGYWLGKDFRNQGIMTAVVRRFVTICFQEKHLFRLEAHIFPENLPSAKVLEKAGFVKEGYMKSSFIKNDELKDSVLYSKVRDLE